MTARVLLLPVFGFAVLATGCDECAGMSSCRVAPHISYGGQVIDHPTGAIVPGTSVMFIRDSGIPIESDTVRGVSDETGHFSLRVEALQDGTVHGHAVVAAPPPYVPYTIPSLGLSTSRVRGGGGFLGRIVAKPYLLLVGHVRDRKTHTPLGKARVIMKRNSGGRLSADSMLFVTDAGGQFAWYPDIIESGTINATFEIRAQGYPRVFRVTRDIPLLFRDGEMSFQILPVGMGFPYWGTTGRRGFGTPIPGALVTIRRLSGIETNPQTVTIPVTDVGTFGIPFEPVSPGSVTVELQVLPPDPFPIETDTIVLPTSDDDIGEWLGFFGYGSHAFFTAELRYADTGDVLPAGILARLKRVSGLPLLWETPADGDLRVVDSTGHLTYGAPTADSGQVVFDMIVLLPKPFAWDTIRGVTIPARYDDVPFDAGVLSVQRRIAP